MTKKMLTKQIPAPPTFLHRLASIASVLHTVPDQALDGELSTFQLALVSTHLVHWPEKARGLGLSESDIDNIREDNKNYNQSQKSAMMRRWKELYGNRATLRNLAEIAEKNGWEESFIHDVVKSLGHDVEQPIKEDEKNDEDDDTGLN